MTGAVFHVYLPEKARATDLTIPTSSLLPATLLHWILSFYSVPHERKRGDFYGQNITTISDPGGYRHRYLWSLGRGKHLACCTATSWACCLHNQCLSYSPLHHTVTYSCSHGLHFHSSPINIIMYSVVMWWKIAILSTAGSERSKLSCLYYIKF